MLRQLEQTLPYERKADPQGQSNKIYGGAMNQPIRHAHKCPVLWYCDAQTVKVAPNIHFGARWRSRGYRPASMHHMVIRRQPHRSPNTRLIHQCQKRDQRCYGAMYPKSGEYDAPHAF